MKKIILIIAQLTLLPVLIQSAELPINKIDYTKMLLDGVLSNKIADVKNAIKNGADINYIHNNTWFNGTPLHLASMLGCTEIIKILLNAKANVDARDRDQ